MTKARLIKKIEEAGQYVKVRISADGDVTGMLVEENYRYHGASNTGGRRYIGKYNDSDLMAQYGDLGDLTAKEAREYLVSEDYNWYIVEYTDGSFDCKHQTGLSSILECGADPADYDIAELHQCWNGEELGEYPF